jgi:hypothetical protein
MSSKEEMKMKELIMHRVIDMGLKRNLSILAIIGALYAGAKYDTIIEKIERGIIYHGKQYSAESAQGPLKVVHVPNAQGQLEERLRNMENGQDIYTIHQDMLPDNGFIYNGLEKRVQTATKEDLKSMEIATERLQDVIDDKMGNHHIPKYLLFGIPGAALLAYGFHRLSRKNVGYIR